MKKLLLTLVLTSSLSTIVKAQTDYYGAIGLGVDVYDEAIFIGAGGKYFFAEKHVGQAYLGFEENATIFTGLYSFHKEIIGKRGLRWYAGLGPSIVLIKESDNIFSLRPHIGLDLKVNHVPFVLNFDWRPSVVLSNVGEHDLIGFGLGFIYVIN